MNTITVSATKKYDVIIGSDLLSSLGDSILTIKKPCTAAIISDSNVWQLYGTLVESSLHRTGFQPIHFVFSAGESSKNSQTYLEILNFLAENKVTRTDCLVALGGGVVGDITGFAAATYLRGIDYIQVPTTLLAMVDSSVGGKTAIDLPAGKNLVGAFYQPVQVICDITTLTTLPHPIFLDGCAEVIKYAMLFDPELFAHLEEYGVNFSKEDVITKCVSWKKDVVMADEFDIGLRQKLNLGHTIGHAIESSSNYTLSHGQAVAAGMAIVTNAGRKLGYCSDADYNRLLSLMKLFSLPTTTQYDAQLLYAAALSDKKRFGGSVNMVIPRKIGECDICSIPVNDLESFIKAGLL